ncbi:MAG: HIRAN domain-containing protein [Gammaproteobacteria bacterium]|nr:HIRAN domain-containing protein [Gammaproteobacteria bacterium]
MFNWLFKSFRKPNIIRSADKLFLLECKIHGSHYYGCHQLLKEEKLFVGEPVILRRETDNEYDKNAIEILTQNKIKLGYVPKKHNTVIASLIDQNCHVCANIESIFPSAWEPITITIVMRLK